MPRFPKTSRQQVRPGNPVEVRAPALPGADVQGHVNAILPEVALATRTLKVRIEVGNSGRRLVPACCHGQTSRPCEKGNPAGWPTELAHFDAHLERTVARATSGRMAFTWPLNIAPGSAGARTSTGLPGRTCCRDVFGNLGIDPDRITSP